MLMLLKWHVITHELISITNRKPKAKVTKVIVEGLSGDARLHSSIEIVGIHTHYLIHFHQVEGHTTLQKSSHD